MQTYRRPQIPMIEPLQSLARPEERQLRCPHEQPNKHHRNNLAWEVEPVRPERLCPRTSEKLSDEEEDNGQEDMVVMLPCCVRGCRSPALSQMPPSSPSRGR